MAEIDDILADVAEESTPVFKYEYLSTGYTNTGGSMQSIEARDNTIVGHIAVATLIHGRKPGRYPPWGYEQGTETPTGLMQWCMDKFGETAKEARSTSFLVARKLKEEGNRVYRGAVPPVPTEGTIDKANEVMFNRVMDKFKETIKGYGLQ